MHLINPQIGHPLVIELKNANSKNEIGFELLFASNENEDEFRDKISGKLEIIPIILYKWKIQRSIETRTFSMKLKDYWDYFKKILRFKKPLKEMKIEVSELDKLGNLTKKILKMTRKDINSLDLKAFRSESLKPTFQKIKSRIPIQIDNLSYLDDEHGYPLRYLNRIDKIKKFQFFYSTSFILELNPEIVDFVNEFNYIMFDILYPEDKNDVNINYHALVVTNNNWKNYTIAQATDLHVAERNDHMIKKIEQSFDKNPQELDPSEINRSLSTLRKRIVNPNDNLRCFINEMNEKVRNKSLDFIFITGDIVDFTISSIKSPEQSNDFGYEKSNWKIFKEIILDLYQPPNHEIKKPEELLCPIFTLPGNHDFKPWQYDLSWFGMYKKVGLKKIESEALKEEYSISPIRAVLKSQNALDAYLTNINPSLDYSLKIGNTLFIFINSGADSYKEIGDYVTGSPTLTGITERQVKYIKNVISKKASSGNQIILSLHGPPINTPLKRGIFKRIEKIFKKDTKTNIEEFRESAYKGQKFNLEKARIDNKFNIKYGTLSSNWEYLLNLCARRCVLALSGHTHILNEYRLKLMDDAENQIAVFYDDYSDIYRSSSKINKNGPFVVQTPALGFKSYKKPGKVAGYRLVKFKKGKLSSFQVKYTRISKYKK